MKKDKLMVSLNPEFGIEVETLIKLAERVRESRPDLYSILTIVVSVVIANDDSELLKHCNTYLTNKIKGDMFYGDLKSALGHYIDFENEDKKKPPPPWFPPFEDDEL
jgi:hypothetical protein